MATKADAEEFSRILQYFKQHGEYPEDAKPKMLAAVKKFQEDEAHLKERVAAREAKWKEWLG